MNNRQKNILEYLSRTHPSEYITQEVISQSTGIPLRDVGSECAKLENSGYVQHGDSQIGEKLKYRITTSGQNYLDEESQKIKNLKHLGLTARGTVILACATVVLALVTFYSSLANHAQTDLMRKDFDVNNRPWIGGFEFRVTNDTVFYDIQNYGKIPNTGGTLTFSLSPSTITRETFPTLDKKSRALAVMMPTQKFSERFTGKVMDGIKNVREGKADLYFAIMIHYTYSEEKFGEYNIIVRYDPAINNFDIMDSWVN